jgi:hypothetical protein
MSDFTDLLSAARYECADPATIKEGEESRRIRRLQQLLAERAAQWGTQAPVIPIRASR